jgi:fermentation-respiration switch protein FrsA (DUF1100 family)
VAFGESLGTAVAIAIAAQRPVGRLILDAPFTSAVDVAVAQYGWLPVRLMMHDAFHSDERIGRVSVPVLVLHGEEDSVIPIAFAERLFERIVSRDKTFIRFPHGGHVNLDGHGAVQAVRDFLARTEQGG